MRYTDHPASIAHNKTLIWFMLAYLESVHIYDLFFHHSFQMSFFKDLCIAMTQDMCTSLMQIIKYMCLLLRGILCACLAPRQLKGIAASDGVVYIYSSSKSCVCVHSNWHSLGINIIVRSFEVQDFIGSAVCYH